MDNESSQAKSFAAAKEHAIQAAAEAKEAGIGERARALARNVDTCVHQNPWLCIAGSAAVGLLLGYILGRKRE